jgi:hypothetical protein
MNEQEALRRHLSKLGKKGGPKGGKARMASLTPEQRKELAQKAAAARWSSTGKAKAEGRTKDARAR